VPQWIVKAARVEESLRALRNLWIHPHFAGYLCIKRTAHRDGRTTKLKPDFKDFFDTFLHVPDAPTDKPYFKPFVDERASSANVWLNSNVAGSFAPSSIRRTLLKVVSLSKTAGARARTFSLKAKHWELAREHLAKGRKIPVVELSAVLYRDHSIQSTSISLRQLVRVFRDEFGYEEEVPSGAEEFRHLFQDLSQSEEGHDWFQMLP